MAETAYGTSEDLAYPPVQLPSLGTGEEQPRQPLQLTISKPSPPVTLQPVDHQPEFETPIRLIPVDHHPQFIDDTGQNAQEAPETLALQQRHLTQGQRPVQMFPAGTDELPLPAGFHRTANDRGAFHYDPTKISEPEILDLSGQGRENEFLGLGPVSKPEVEHRVARGERPLAITEYTPDGAEVRSAAGTDKTAPVQQKFFEQTKQPGNIVAVGPPPARIPPSFGFQPTPEQNEMAKRFLAAMNYMFLGAPMQDKSGNWLPPSYGLPGQAIDLVAEPGRIAADSQKVSQMPQTGMWSDEQEAMRQAETAAIDKRKVDWGTSLGLQMLGMSQPFVKPSPNVVGLFGGPGARSVRDGGPLQPNMHRAQAIDAVMGHPDRLQRMSEETGKTIPALVDELRKHIWDETGFFKGIDGKWRHEIPDIGASIKEGYPVDKPGHWARVGDVLDHPWLFKEYPELAKTPIYFEKDTGQRYTGWRRDNGDIGIVSKEATPENLAEMRLSILHELQHNIQGVEEFTSGSRPDDPAMVPVAKFILKQRQAPALAKLEAWAQEANQWIQNNPGMTKDDYIKRFPKTIEEMALLKSIVDQSPFALDRIMVEIYQKSAGEAESANVEARSLLDEEARKMAHPDYTAPYPREQQILSPTRPKLQLQAKTEPRPPAEPFYSAVAKAIEDIPQEKAPAAQWAGMLRNKPGVKPEELKWLGLDEWLREQKGPVTKQQIGDFVRANQIEVKEVMKGAPDRALIDKRVEAMAESDAADFYNDEGVWPDRHQMENIRQLAYERLIEEMPENFPGKTKFDKYQMPDSRGNYRELLLTLPETTPKIEVERKRLLEIANAYDPPYPDSEVKAAMARLQELNKQYPVSKTTGRSEGFKSSHWDEPNVLAHIRFNDRVIDGKKTLFVEEVQSDWHQSGKRQGYQKPELTEAEQNRFKELDNKMMKVGKRGMTPEEIAEVNDLYQRRQLAGNRTGLVPDAPFKTTWPELAMKRIIKYAADNGYDKVAWTPGDVQAARYDLSKHVDSITVVPAGEMGSGSKRWNMATPSGNFTGAIITNKDGTINLAASEWGDVRGKHISEVIGKDIAEKGLAAEGETKISGVDLKVGGEGMKGFYDQMLPNMVNKLVKKFGGKVEKQKLEEGGPPRRELTGEVQPQGGPEADMWQIRWSDGSYSGGYGSRASAGAARDRRLEQRAKSRSDQAPMVHTVDITPQMQTAVREQGMPMFREKGAAAGPPDNIIKRGAQAVADWWKNQPSWLEQATEQSRKDAEAFSRGGAKEMFKDTETTKDLAGGFGGTTEAVGSKIAGAVAKVPGRGGNINPMPTPEDLTGLLRRQAARPPNVGAAKNEAIRLPDTHGPLREGERPPGPVYVGKVNLDQWIARTEGQLTREEIAAARNWYRDALKVYERYFGKEKAPAMLGAWLTANVNATPSFAQLSAVRTLEQFKNRTGAFAPQKQGGLAHEKLMQYWDAILSNDLSKLGQGGSGQKIYDFIDSALLKDTRTYYGDSPQAGAPAVADVHSLRDMGFVDQALLNWVEEKYGKEVAAKLARDSEGLSPGEAQYEWTADKMRSFTDELNKRNYMGGGWEPHELQAVGWTAMSKMLGRKAETSSAAIEANIRNLSYELDFGAGAPYHQQFAEWGGLSGSQKAQVTREVMPHILDFAKTITGAHEFARVEGTGGWGQFTNPSFKSRLIASPEVAKDVADIVGYLAQQTKIFGYRGAPNGPRLGVALYADALKDPATSARLWQTLIERHPDLAAGFSPSVNAGGTHGLEIILDKGGAKMAQRIEKELIPALDDIAKEMGIDVDAHSFRAEEQSSEHDWTKDPEGRSYLSRLSARYGPDIQKRLELFKRKKLEPALRQAIERADPTTKAPAKGAAPAGPVEVQPVTRADELKRLGQPRATTSPPVF